MKKIKSSVFALLSATALLFSSCLGSSDYTPSIGCTGTPLGSLSSEVMLDNGVIASLSGVDASALMNLDRIFVYGQLSGESAELETVNPGDKVSIVHQIAVELTEIDYVSETEFNELNLSEVSNFGWFTVGSVFNALNGYMNFVLVGDFYAKKASDSESYSLVAPSYYMTMEVDTSAKIVDLVFGYDNHAEMCTDENGDLKDGYRFYEETALLDLYGPGLYFDTTSLYRELNEAGIADEDTITFNIYTAKRNKETGEIEKEKVSLSYTGIQKGLLKRTYRGGY